MHKIHNVTARKNVYLYFTSKDFRYLTVEATDDNGERFSYALDGGGHEKYLRSAKDMCERFEKFCKDVCGLYDARYCGIWATNFFSPIPLEFEYESLFDISTIHTKEYAHYFAVYKGYTEYDLDTLIGRCDWACCQYLSTQYDVKRSHLQAAQSFDVFLNEYLSEQTADGVRSAVAAYKKYIDKDKFTVCELANVKAFMLKNIDAIFDRYETSITDTHEKLTTEFALIEAAIRLYLHDKTTFKEIIHTLLDKLNKNRRRTYSDAYNFILHFFDYYYDEFFDTPFEGALSDRTFPSDFCSPEDMLRIREMIFRTEGR